MLKEMKAANFSTLAKHKPKAQGTKGSLIVTHLRKSTPGKIIIKFPKINYQENALKTKRKQCL